MQKNVALKVDELVKRIKRGLADEIALIERQGFKLFSEAEPDTWREEKSGITLELDETLNWEAKFGQFKSGKSASLEKTLRNLCENLEWQRRLDESHIRRLEDARKKAEELIADEAEEAVPAVEQECQKTSESVLDVIKSLENHGCKRVPTLEGNDRLSWTWPDRPEINVDYLNNKPGAWRVRVGKNVGPYRPTLREAIYGFYSDYYYSQELNNIFKEWMIWLNL